jgi:aspartyl-tRNA(Asn)/glutamyl-tRNA(Gln) amidotransferase subunit A
MTDLTYAAARQALLDGETSCAALVSAFLARIESENARLNAFLRVDADRALQRARELDEQRHSGEDIGPLHGMVIAVKDMICQKDHVVSCGSRMLADFESLYDATAVERLEAAGAVIIGRTNCDEFGMGSSNENSHFGPVRNPRDTDRVPGGSSGGSAAAVAAGLCHAALGTDTGGSIRQPAALCGVVGLKPTYGRVSRYGLVAYASSFDVIGPIARSAEDAGMILEVIAGHDDRDTTSASVEVPGLGVMAGRSVDGLRVGIPREYLSDDVDSEVRQTVRDAAATLKEAGADVREVSLPHTNYGIATYYILTTAEASSNLGRYDGVRYGFRASPPKGGKWSLGEMYTATRSQGFGAEVKRRIMLGTYVLSSGYYDAYYAKAQRVRSLVRRDFEEVFRDVDVLLTPATPGPAFRLGEKTSDPLTMYLSDVFTVGASLAGVPGLVVPGGTTSGGLPIGVQFLARHFDEAVLIQAGDALMKMPAPHAGGMSS